MSHIWQIQHRLFVEQLEAIEVKPTQEQLVRLVSATRASQVICSGLKHSLIGRIVFWGFGAVCGDARRGVDELDVRQPELARGSMTKLQRDFLEHGNESIREQLLTLNVRHSLSTALVACLGRGLVSVGVWNVNDLVHQEMWDLVDYVRGEHFGRLLHEEVFS